MRYRACLLLCHLCAIALPVTSLAQDTSHLIPPTVILSDDWAAMVQNGIPPYATVDASALSADQLGALAGAFGVAYNTIERYLWAPSMAPVGHADEGTIVYVIWIGSAEAMTLTYPASDSSKQVSFSPSSSSPRISSTESKHQSRGTANGALTGMLVGALAGGILGYGNAAEPCDGDAESWCAFSRKNHRIGEIAFGSAVGGGVGLLIGTLVGHATNDDFDPVVSTGASRSGVSVVACYRF